MTSAYRGRFAPSPTGPLHFGSLVAALASYLDARAHNGQWMVRIEDLDPLREPPGAARQILQSLEVHHLQSDEPVRYQSNRHHAYDRAIEQLLAHHQAYRCPCSRRELREHDGRHPRHCREQPQPADQAHAIRLTLDDATIGWTDRALGEQAAITRAEIDDPVIRRKEGFYAYQLAVVVDDMDQGITDVVRGDDLLDTTPAQIRLYDLLGGTTPSWLHLPVILNTSGQKLSKQTHAPPLDDDQPGTNLFRALQALGQSPPATLASASPASLIDWGIRHWRPDQLPAQPAPAPDSAGDPMV
ncbi:glutamyl-Q tRNA(Asp) synthetase [Tamilnaduibacter salinus]|uniref:Glutamyl-Q tRNA(Asp) synthetase n=1 Tax=Tamilnaduibacter salinus TaxID=1484056 RepID=A0A2A2I8X3_9GAMM|nr:tRNA glutamyl-Q(34) synthetase GluQRS [Tamilnaduibacter salinus]PAV27513.1 tRNA glutamyl-Q(34) synthetase GluQRS [Tamilnaduibacter salinus]PVY77040.1 glutamyl-Q tRNA(Asp) synthetase [Tamilnaduibacter salinus]